MPPAEKILVRGVNWLGDAVMTTPALQRLREARPDAHISLLTHEKLCDLWLRHPSLNEVMTFKAGEGVFHLAGRLRGEGFDTAVVFPNSFRSVLETFLAKIPRRIGYRGNARSVLLTQTLPRRAGDVRMHKRSHGEIDRRIAQNAARETFPPSAHHAHDYLHLVAALGAKAAPLPPLLHVGEEEVAAVRARFDLPDGPPWFALNPGAEYGGAKRWPEDRFVEAAVQMHERTACRWLILGGPADRELADRIASEIAKHTGQPVTNLAARTSLRELCAVLKACALLLTNDTGPMHVAAAVGTPVVVPFGSTSPELTGPWSAPGRPHQIIVGNVSCAPCFRRECPVDFRCMTGISAAEVAQAAWRVWQARPGS